MLLAVGVVVLFSHNKKYPHGRVARLTKKVVLKCAHESSQLEHRVKRKIKRELKEWL